MTSRILRSSKYSQQSQRLTKKCTTRSDTMNQLVKIESQQTYKVFTSNSIIQTVTAANSRRSTLGWGIQEKTYQRGTLRGRPHDWEGYIGHRPQRSLPMFRASMLQRWARGLDKLKIQTQMFLNQFTEMRRAPVTFTTRKNTFKAANRFGKSLRTFILQGQGILREIGIDCDLEQSMFGFMNMEYIQRTLSGLKIPKTRVLYGSLKQLHMFAKHLMVQMQDQQFEALKTKNLYILQEILYKRIKRDEQDQQQSQGYYYESEERQPGQVQIVEQYYRQI